MKAKHIIFVHGLFGWGKDEMAGFPYYGKGITSMKQQLANNGAKMSVSMKQAVDQSAHFMIGLAKYLHRLSAIKLITTAIKNSTVIKTITVQHLKTILGKNS